MDKSLATVLGFAAAALLVPGAPAAAQAGASPYAVSARAVRKSEALLGTGSRLAQLMAQQQGSALPAPSSATSASAPVATAPMVTASLPASFAARPITLLRRAVVAGRPDVFGSVALPIAATPLDRRWQAAASRPADSGTSRWAASLRDRPEAERIELINRFVNARIAFVDDERQFGRADVWQGAAESLDRGRGDCEDYALAKRALLRAAGLAERDLFLVIVKDLVRRSDHAVLAVASGGRLLVLDNGTDRIVDAADISDYRPIFTYSADRRWTHGYRRDAEPPMVLAAATPTGSDALPVPASAPALTSIAFAEPTFTFSAADLKLAPLG
jgi:predicted transglutaminase-like cysteine proteinase